jgi:elongation factor P--(R)-beta-lysine ligase
MVGGGNQAQAQTLPKLAALHARAKLYRLIRRYFDAQNVMEVETPIMAGSGNTDPAIESFFSTDLSGKPVWLRTSPEFFHKRLLCAGLGDLFEIAKVFRRGEISRRHRPEFTLLEFYRTGFDEFDLIADLTALVRAALRDFDCTPMQSVHLRYCDWFERDAGFHPLHIELGALRARVAELGVIPSKGLPWNRDDCLDLVRTHGLEAQLAPQQLTYIYDFPASQAALAELNADGKTARRFELFAGGFELANGYFELTDPAEQAARFARDVAVRTERGMASVHVDQELLAALTHGLPKCAGVALGLDRLLMLLTGAGDIADV